MFLGVSFGEAFSTFLHVQVMAVCETNQDIRVFAIKAYRESSNYSAVSNCMIDILQAHINTKAHSQITQRFIQTLREIRAENSPLISY